MAYPIQNDLYEEVFQPFHLMDVPDIPDIVSGYLGFHEVEEWFRVCLIVIVDLQVRLAFPFRRELAGHVRHYIHQGMP